MDKIIKTLNDAYDAIMLLPPDVLGWASFVEGEPGHEQQCRYPLRDELLHEIASAIKHAEAIKAHRIKMHTAGL